MSLPGRVAIEAAGASTLNIGGRYGGWTVFLRPFEQCVRDNEIPHASLGDACQWSGCKGAVWQAEQRALNDELANLKKRETSVYICHLSSAAAAKVGKVS